MAVRDIKKLFLLFLMTNVLIVAFNFFMTYGMSAFAALCVDLTPPILQPHTGDRYVNRSNASDPQHKTDDLGVWQYCALSQFTYEPGAGGKDFANEFKGGWGCDVHLDTGSGKWFLHYQRAEMSDDQDSTTYCKVNCFNYPAPHSYP